MSYRNCTYNNAKKCITLWTWDSRGNRITQEIDYKPYLFLEDKNGLDKSIYGTPIKKKEFKDNWERNKFVKESGIKKIFENLPPYQQFLIDNYSHNCGDDNFSDHPLKVMTLDIENPHPSKFADIDLADTVINLLTCHDSISDHYTMFGLKKYTPSRKNVTYHHCKSEHDLLKKFIGHFSHDYPDCVVGWNSSGYDIPYLINRITFELGKDWADELSPIGRIYEKINPTGKFGMPTKEYTIEGISCLDYMVLYKKFETEPHESHALNYIAEVELGENKIEYDGSLWELSVNDWDRYCEYNIVDVELIIKLDKKLDYLSLIRFIAYNGLCGLQQAIGTVPVINGAIALEARKRNEYIPTFVKPKRTGDKNPGGFVQETKRGFANNMVTFDANSLYPSVMISLNISPETKIGLVEKIGNMVNIHHVSGKTYELTPLKFMEYLKAEKTAISKSGHLFSQKKKGIMPEFLDNLYTKRKLMKAKGLDLKNKLNKIRSTLTPEEISKMESDIQKFNTFQHAYKILLNSAYGYTGNPYAPLADDDIASSVTLSGQAVNKKNKILFKEYLIQRFDITEEEAENCCIAGDTDSGMFSLGVLSNKGYDLLDDKNNIRSEFIELCDDIENHINTEITKWAITTFRTIDSRLIYKREGICDKSIFLAKKLYVAHVLNDEGVEVNKFKYKGVSVVKTTMPKLLKPYLKEIMEDMVMNQNMKSANVFFNTAYDLFKTLPIENISRINGINTFDKYVKGCDKFLTSKGMTEHMRAAHYHNVLLDELDINKSYKKLKTGDKVRYIAVNGANKYGIDCVGYMGKYPKEFLDIFDINYEKMFEHLFYKNIKLFYTAAGWFLRKPTENVKVELDDLFN